MAESIVVGTDGSDSAQRAVAEAIRMAEALNAEIHLVSAFDNLRLLARIEPTESSRKVRICLGRWS